MTLACTIDASGISAPSYADILSQLQASYRGIYGADVYLEPDSQDGQLLAIFAAALNDGNAATIAAYNAFSPATAQGVGLSSVVKVNGITRAVSTYSTGDVLIVGQAGTTITNGAVGASDTSTRWNLPPTVIVPYGGEITVTATAADPGAVTALPNTLTQILTPTFGWQTVTNPAAAAVGAPVELDPALKQRQTVSTALPSQTVLDGIVGAVSQITGVLRVAAYDNDSHATDANGQPPNSIAMVVDGGDAQAIASAIYAKKTPGAATYGTTTQQVQTAYGALKAINFFWPTSVPVTVAISLQTLPGYTSAIGRAVAAAVAAAIAALPIGGDVLVTRLYVAANLAGGPGSETFDVLSLAVARDGGSPSPANLTIAFNEAAACSAAAVTVTTST